MQNGADWLIMNIKEAFARKAPLKDYCKEKRIRSLHFFSEKKVAVVDFRRNRPLEFIFDHHVFK